MARPFVDFRAEEVHAQLLAKGVKFIDSLGTPGNMSFGDRIEAAKACAMLAEACKTNGAGA